MAVPPRPDLGSATGPDPRRPRRPVLGIVIPVVALLLVGGGVVAFSAIDRSSVAQPSVSDVASPSATPVVSAPRFDYEEPDPVEGAPEGWHRYSVPSRFQIVGPADGSATYDDGYFSLAMKSPFVSCAVWWRNVPLISGRQVRRFLQRQADRLQDAIGHASGRRWTEVDGRLALESRFRRASGPVVILLTWDRGWMFRVDATLLPLSPIARERAVRYFRSFRLADG